MGVCRHCLPRYLPGRDQGDGIVTELGGGQLWVQEQFPFFHWYLVYLIDGRWVLIAPPLDEPGCISRSSPDGTGIWLTEELEKFFADHGFTCKGQYYRVTMDEVWGR